MRLVEKVLPFTPEGKEELSQEVDLLEGFRREILNECEVAPEQVKEVLRRELAAVEEQIFLLREALARGEVIGNTGLTVCVGSEVTLETEYGTPTFKIVGPVSAAPRRGCISYESPLGQALLGAQLGDWVEFAWDGDRRRLRVIGIKRGRLTENPTPLPDPSSGFPPAFRAAFG